MTREKLLATIRRIARKSGRDSVSLSEFRARRGCSNRAFRRHFRYWNDAVEAAGLKASPATRDRDSYRWRHRRSWRKGRAFAREELIERIRTIARERRLDTVSILQFLKYTGLSKAAYRRHFRFWNDAVLAAGLKARPSGINKGAIGTQPGVMTREEVLDLLRKTAAPYGRNAVSVKQFRKRTGFSVGRVKRHFRRWNDAVRAAGLRPLDRQGWVVTPIAEEREHMITHIRAFTKNCGGKCPTFRDFSDSTRNCKETIERAFGGWKEFLKAAGLSPRKRR